MTSVGDLLFVLVCAGFVAHELDAVHEREWRLLYGLRRIADETLARNLFVGLHVPLIVGLALLFGHPDHGVADASRLAFEAFAVVHAGLHVRIRARGSDAFASLPSRAIIHGTAITGLLALALRALG